MSKNQSRRRAKAAGLAARTEAMRHMAMSFSGAYSGASLTRPALSGWMPRAGDAAADSVRDLHALRSRSRDLVRNSPLATGAINTLVTNVVGTGLTLQSVPDCEVLGMDDEAAEEWAETTEREFKLFCDTPNCDVTRTQNFYGLQSLALRSAMESGDSFAILPSIKRPQQVYQLAIQLVEADRVSNPNFGVDNVKIVAGVEQDEWGAPIAYHFSNHHPGALVSRSLFQWKRVTAFGTNTGRRNVLHLFDRKRIGQVRGIPMLAPVIEPLKQLQRYTDAELQAAVISGMFSVFIKMDSEAFHELFDGDAQSTYLKNSMEWDGSLNAGTLDGAGKAINLLPGESVESATPGRPNALFDPFVQAIIRQIGVSLEIPFEVLIKHFTSSYSAARAALLDAWRFFRGRRDWLATVFCQPVYEAWLEEAVAIGRIKAPGFFADPAIRKAWSTAAWIGDGPGSIDPQKEVEAAGKRIELGISTIAAESLLHDGIDWRVKHKQRTVELKERQEAGLDLPDPSAPAPIIEPDKNDNEEKKPQMHISINNQMPQVSAPNVEVTVEAVMPEPSVPNITLEIAPSSAAAIYEYDNSKG